MEIYKIELKGNILTGSVTSQNGNIVVKDKDDLNVTQGSVDMNGDFALDINKSYFEVQGTTLRVEYTTKDASETIFKEFYVEPIEIKVKSAFFVDSKIVKIEFEPFSEIVQKNLTSADLVFLTEDGASILDINLEEGEAGNLEYSYLYDLKTEFTNGEVITIKTMIFREMLETITIVVPLKSNIHATQKWTTENFLNKDTIGKTIATLEETYLNNYQVPDKYLAGTVKIIKGDELVGYPELKVIFEDDGIKGRLVWKDNNYELQKDHHHQLHDSFLVDIKTEKIYHGAFDDQGGRSFMLKEISLSTTGSNLQEILKNGNTTTSDIGMNAGQLTIDSLAEKDIYGKSFYVQPYERDGAFNLELSTAIYDTSTDSFKYPIFIGPGALFSLNSTNVTNASNSTIAIGYSAMREFTASSSPSTYNHAIGSSALKKLLGGHSNNVFGGLALSELTNGNVNTAVGHNAGKTITTGSNNTFIGSGSGNGLTTANGNTIIGNVSNTIIGSTTATNQVIIAQSGTANKIVFRTKDTGETTVPLQTNALIEADVTGKSVVTKEYINSKYIVSEDTNYPTLTAFKTKHPNLKVGDAVYYPNLNDVVQKKIVFLGNDMYVEEIINKL